MSRYNINLHFDLHRDDILLPEIADILAKLPEPHRIENKWEKRRQLRKSSNKEIINTRSWVYYQYKHSGYSLTEPTEEFFSQWNNFGDILKILRDDYWFYFLLTYELDKLDGTYPSAKFNSKHLEFFWDIWIDLDLDIYW